MKKQMFLVSGLFVVLMALGSWTINSNDSKTEEATYLGYVQDEELGNEYYSFETSDNYLDFFNINPAVLKSYNLKSSDFDGKAFEITYTENEDDGEMLLEKVQLID